MPKVSIGLPVFNGERYLTDALDSLVGQRFDDFELIISDNASTDGTQEICRAFVERDDRVRYVRNRVNVGVSGNFNQAFRLSEGEFFKWAAYDDICEPDFLARCVEALEGDPGAVLAYPRVAMIDEHGRVTQRRDPAPDMDAQDPAVRMSTLMKHPFWATPIFGLSRSSVLAKTRLMRNNAACDHVLLAELSFHGRFIEIPHWDFLNREHPGRTLAKSSIVQRALYMNPRLPRVPFLLRAMQAGAYLEVLATAPVDPRTRLRGLLAVGGWLSERVASRLPGMSGSRPSAVPSTRNLR